MLLTYDDNAKIFIFDLEHPMEDVMDFADLIEVQINIPGGISSFPRAYAIAKIFERSSNSVINHVHGIASKIHRESLDKKLRETIDNAENMITQAQEDHANDDMPEDMLELISTGSQSTIDACHHFMEAPEEEIQNSLFLHEMHICETGGIAFFSLPGVGDSVVRVDFTMTMPKIETDIERAMVEREAAAQLH